MRLQGCDSVFMNRAGGSSPAGRAGQTSAFAKYLDIDLQRKKMRELPPGRMLDSVYMQFMDDYRAWKAGQPEAVLPDSQGWTEENLDFLRERYAGDLSAFEIYGALETMEKLGMLNEKGLRCAEGTTMIRMEMKAGFVETSADPDSRAAWLHGFDQAPMTGFQSLEDILSWARDFRENDWPESITYAEAVARSWM